MCSYVPSLSATLRGMVAPGILCVVALASVAAASEARLLRYPAIHDDFVVFVHAGDVWRAPTAGGRAWRLTSHEGVELTPKISPDGAWVAYSAEYTGTRQVYVVPSGGGAPKQLTFYNDVGAMPPRGGFDNWIQGWTPDGKILVRMNRTPWGPRPGRYYLVDPEGGLERPLPIPIGGSASLSPDGRTLAYTYFDREFRTWKRYFGGRNQDIWTYDLEADTSKRLTDWAGSDNFPMWVGDTIYFTSDRDGGTMNLWSMPAAGGEPTRRTEFDTWDVLWPSQGPGGIVFLNGGWLYRFDPATGESRRIAIEIGSEVAAAVPHWKDVSGDVAAVEVSPDGKRAVFEARGDLFSVPAKDGPTRNLTDTQGVRESAPAWSPDGRYLAYWTDASGEMALIVRDRTAEAEPRTLVPGERVWRYPPVWSPDSATIAWGDSDHRLQIVDVDSGETTLVATGTRGDIDTYRWSPDGRLLAYETTHPATELPAIAVYAIEGGTTVVLGDGTTFDFSPVFSADGTYLFFLSQRDYNLQFSDFEFNFVYDDSTRVYAAALDPAAEPLFPPKSDEVEIDRGERGDDDGGAKPEKTKKGKKSAGKKAASPRVVAEGFAARTVALPGVEAGNYGGLAAVEGAVLYIEDPGGEKPRLMRYDLAERKADEIAAGVRQYVLAARGENVLAAVNGTWKMFATKPGDEGTALDLAGLRMKLDPRAEWAQMFDEAWRIGRDWFYDENMHGLDWEGIGERYRELVPYVAHRSDLDFIFGEMVAELEAGHAYVQSGDEPQVERVEGGMLGAELEATRSGRYRIARIYPGENWDEAYRSPLTEPGVDARPGEFLLAIDGVDLTTSDNPYRLLEGKAGTQVTLTLGDEPDPEGARTVRVRTIASEANLRYLDWVRSRAALVDRLSGGKIGYIHLPDTAVDGNRMLQKMFYSQVSRPGLIVDDRYNGGGFIPDRMIEMLSRTTLSYWARRGIESFTTPGFAHDGPKAMLINGYAASGGDALPYYFRKQGLGPLIGTRTWGGLIGLSGNPMLVDGGGVLYPTFRFYDTEGAWAVENEGVPPDIEVWDLPERIAEGGDPSIEKAVEVLLEAIERRGTAEPEAPAPPDMSGD